MNLTKSINIFLVLVFFVPVNTVNIYEWDSERQAAARFLTEKLFGAVMNQKITRALNLVNNINLNKLKKKKLGKYNKSVLRNKLNGISKKKLNIGSNYQNKKPKIIETKYIKTSFNNTKNTYNKKIRNFGNFKSHLFLNKSKIPKEEKIFPNRFFINSGNIQRQKMIEVEASPFIRELAFEDHDLDIVAPNIAGIKTLIVDEPLEFKKSYY